MDVKLIADKLTQPPFSKNYSVIQLHDEVPVHTLLQLITDAAATIDDGPNSVHKVDIRMEEPEATAWRISDLLRVLKFRGASGADSAALRQKLVGEERELFLEVLGFLLKDLATHKKRAYLAQYLETVEIPPDYMHDDAILELSEQVSTLQDQFKELHKFVDGLRNTGKAHATANLKKEIQMMEEEKQQVTNKISRIRKKVQEIPNHETWLEAAKALRVEQQTEVNLTERIKEQRTAVTAAEKRYSAIQQKHRDVRSTLNANGPDALFAKVEEDFKMNKYLATENLPKAVTDAKQRVKELNKVIAEPHPTEHDFLALDREIKELGDKTAELAETRLMKNNSGDDKLALFRQQAVIISRKKEGAAQKLNAIAEDIQQLKDELEKKKETAKTATGTKVLKGEEFKRYVSELRGKSNILTSRAKSMETMLRDLEKRAGVQGHHEAKDNLEKVSEKKSELDEAKGRTLNEISEIIQTVMTTVNDKKALLSPIIQELRNVRSRAAEVESEYLEKKRHFDATMEMKAYIGGDDAIEHQQKTRGFKTYRDLYNRKILEQENLGKSLREQQRDIKLKYEPSIRQIGYFGDVKKFLELKVLCNTKVMAGGSADKNEFEGKLMTQDRLVL
ncbi:Intraflagellar transport protein 81 [Irineochytrium annulatum]|nr:Intraflagellar transport protein 81 [Irineochytrium annulatum]